MLTPFEPNLNQWYRDQEGRTFEVVAMDDIDIEVQYSDGELDEFDMETWYLLNLSPTEIPKDWTGSYETLTANDSDMYSGLINIDELESEELFEESY